MTIAVGLAAIVPALQRPSPRSSFRALRPAVAADHMEVAVDRLDMRAAPDQVREGARYGGGGRHRNVSFDAYIYRE